MSKVLASELHVGYLVLLAQLAQQIENGFFNTTVKTSALNTTIASTATKEHVIRQIIQNKVNLTRRANILFEQYSPTAPTDQLADYALFRRLPLKSIQDTAKIKQVLASINIRCFGPDRFQISASSNDHFLRVSLSASRSPNELKTDLKGLREFLQKANLKSDVKNFS